MSATDVDGSAWAYAHVGATVVITVPIAVLGLITCFKGRRRADPARTGFVWLKAAFALYFVSFVFLIVNSAASAVLINAIDGGYEGGINEWNKLSFASTYVSAFFHLFADMALLISFVEVGNGFMYALTQTRSSGQKLLRNITFVLMTPLVIMNLVNLGYASALYSRLVSGTPTQASNAVGKLRTLDYLSVSINVLLFIYSILTTVYASIVRHRYRSIEPSGKTVTLYLVATVLTTVPRTLAWMIYACITVFVTTYVYIDIDVPVRLVLSQLVVLITLVLMYVVNTRKQAGLWTTLQPWMNGALPSLVHRSQLYYGVGPNGQAAYYQYPAQGQAAVGYGQPQPQQPYYGWQQQQQWQQPWLQQPQEVHGVSPSEAPSGEHAHMLPANGPELRPANQVHHEMNA